MNQSQNQNDWDDDTWDNDWHDWGIWQEEEDDLGCCFPEECLMVGTHRKGDCYTIEMLDLYEQQPQLYEQES